MTIIEIKERPPTKQLLTFAVNLVEANVKPFYGPDWCKKTKLRELSLPAMTFLVATVDNTLAGFAAFLVDLEPNQDDTTRLITYLYEIQVKQEFRSRGIGAGLMEEVERRARRHGCTWCMLTHFGANVRASRFYERLGYGIDWNSPEGKHYVILSKRL